MPFRTVRPAPQSTDSSNWSLTCPTALCKSWFLRIAAVTWRKRRKLWDQLQLFHTLSTAPCLRARRRLLLRCANAVRRRLKKSASSPRLRGGMVRGAGWAGRFRAACGN